MMKKATSNPFIVLVLCTLLAACGCTEQKPAPGTTEKAETSEFSGNADKGKLLYITCATCHGQQAEGMKALGAPALAGQEAYYLRQQLNNFRLGKRGVHPTLPLGGGTSLAACGARYSAVGTLSARKNSNFVQQ